MKEVPHSGGTTLLWCCGCGVFELREALPQRLFIRIHDRSVVAPFRSNIIALQSDAAQLLPEGRPVDAQGGSQTSRPVFMAP